MHRANYINEPATWNGELQENRFVRFRPFRRGGYSILATVAIVSYRKRPVPVFPSRIACVLGSIMFSVPWKDSVLYQPLGEDAEPGKLPEPRQSALIQYLRKYLASLLACFFASTTLLLLGILYCKSQNYEDGFSTELRWLSQLVYSSFRLVLNMGGHRSCEICGRGRQGRLHW